MIAEYFKVYPFVKTVEVEEIGLGTRWEGKRVYHKESVGEYIDCSNPVCYRGGVSIGSTLREMVHNRQSELETSKMCRGYEGSPKGRRKYRDCLNVFKVRVSVVYKKRRSNESQPLEG